MSIPLQVSQEEWVDRLTPHSSCSGVVPASLALKSHLLPLYLAGDDLVCAVSDPYDPELISQFQFQVQRRIKLLFAPEEALDEALLKHFGSSPFPELDEFVRAVKLPAKVIKGLREDKTVLDWSLKPLKTIGVHGGKGGTGKTTIACNLATELALKGFRTSLYDADFDLPNAHLSLGIEPKKTIANCALMGDSLMDCLTLGFGGLKVLAGSPGLKQITEWKYSELEERDCGYDRFLAHFDFLIVDLPAGVSDTTLSQLLETDEVILVSTADPASLQDSYVTAKEIRSAKPNKKIHLVINKVKNANQAEKVVKSALRFFSDLPGEPVHVLGWISASDSLEQATAHCRPLAFFKPKDKVRAKFVQLAEAFYQPEISR